MRSPVIDPSDGDVGSRHASVRGQTQADPSCRLHLGLELDLLVVKLPEKLELSFFVQRLAVSEVVRCYNVSPQYGGNYNYNTKTRQQAGHFN